MKKKLWLIVSVFVLISVAVYSAVGWIFFWGNRNQVGASNDNYSAPIKATYTVQFVSRGGSAVDARTVGYGQTVTKPQDPTFGSYEFLGWFLNLDDVDSFNFNTPITSDIVLYARWNVTLYTVSFDACGGTAVNAQTVVKGKEATEPTTTWEGYEFLGWYTDENYTTEFDFDQQITSDVTLYAKWSIEFSLSADGSYYSVSGYRGTAPVITIPAVYRGKPVRDIDDFVFKQSQNLKTVVIEDGLVKIGFGAFSECINLNEVVLPESLTEIDAIAFMGCASLSTINVSNGVKIGRYAFYDCPITIS